MATPSFRRSIPLGIAASILAACQTIDLSGPGPENTGGFLIDYVTCDVGQDVFSAGAQGYHPTWSGLGRRHGGIDFHTDLGIPVIAAAPGTVARKYGGDERATYNKGNGQQVILYHGGFYTVYSHLKDIPKDLSNGDSVERGEVIGHIGLTGASTVPHLHFALYRNINPRGFLPNLHEYWHVPAEDRARKTVTVPFFEEGKAYPHDDLITVPLLKEDCGKPWTTFS